MPKALSITEVTALLNTGEWIVTGGRFARTENIENKRVERAESLSKGLLLHADASQSTVAVTHEGARREGDHGEKIVFTGPLPVQQQMPKAEGGGMRESTEPGVQLILTHRSRHDAQRANRRQTNRDFEETRRKAAAKSTEARRSETAAYEALASGLTGGAATVSDKLLAFVHADGVMTFSIRVLPDVVQLISTINGAKSVVMTVPNLAEAPDRSE